MKITISIILLLISLSSEENRLKVGIKLSEPWVMFDKTKSPKERNPIGFSIDLWKEISKNLNMETDFIYYKNTSELIIATEKKEIDLAIAAITINSSREKVINFSNSMYELGLQVMINKNSQSTSIIEIMISEIYKMMTIPFLLSFLLFLFITINLRWFFDKEEKENHLFSRNYKQGIVEAFWWGITMLVTWETPINKGVARVIDLLWHIVGIISISILTAIVTSALTTKSLNSSIKSKEDLIGKYIAAVETDAPKKYLEKLGVNVVNVKNLEEGIDLLKKGKVEGVVHDGPRLIYLANKENTKNKKESLMILPFEFNLQNYGISFPSDSLLTERVNQILLELRESDGISDSFHQTIRDKWIKN